MFTRTITLSLFLGLVLAAGSGCGNRRAADQAKAETPPATPPAATDESSPALLSQGKDIFRFDTFGNEVFWSDTLRMHEVIEKNVDPTTALKVGLKVDADVLPPGILQQVDLKSPATTVALLKMNAVVGLKAEVDATITSPRSASPARSAIPPWTTR